MESSLNKEIVVLWDKINSMDKKISDFIGSVHSTSTDGINENSDGILDIADIVDSMQGTLESFDARIKALEDK